MARRRRNMGTLWLDWMLLGLESQQAMALRVLKLSRGGARARRESSLMVTEKALAAMAAGRQVLKTGSTAGVVKGYRAKVRSNIRRLSR